MADLISKSKAELTSEQWNAKMALCRICIEDTAVENDKLVLTLTKKEFKDKGLPVSYYKELKKNLKDVNDYLANMKLNDPDNILNLDSLFEVAKKNVIDVYPESIE
ncbi:hypothetical protein [Bacteroides acidifaciens]|uniref:hypothetical protein n=1 Tax=Bacteroides acidifaciens TaxID=85831 RepID=UPI003F5D2DA7